MEPPTEGPGRVTWMLGVEEAEWTLAAKLRLGEDCEAGLTFALGDGEVRAPVRLRPTGIFGVVGVGAEGSLSLRSGELPNSMAANEETSLRSEGWLVEIHSPKLLREPLGVTRAKHDNNTRSIKVRALASDLFPFSCL